jgi:cellulose synthase operon protein C
MSPRCDMLHAFVAGRLTAGEKEQFREHLGTCTKCQETLPDVVVLDGMLTDLAPSIPQPAEIIPIPSQRSIVAQKNNNVRSILRPLLGVAAAAVVAVVVAGPVRTAYYEHRRSVLIASAIDHDKRTLEARLAHRGLATHAPYSPTLDKSARACSSMKEIAKLEALGDYQAAAGVYLSACGPEYFEEASRALDLAQSSPEVESDRAALLLAKRETRAALEKLLELLNEHPKHGPARWNLALALRDAGLNLGARLELLKVADRKEAGWSEEASERAASLRAQIETREQDWRTGRTWFDDATRFPSDLEIKHPWLARRAFYHSARLASSREQVTALLPLARSLDRRVTALGLEKYLERLAEEDFNARAPLIKIYRELELRSRTEKIASYDPALAELLRSGRADLIVGILAATRNIPAHLAEFQAAAKTLNDPWFTALAEEYTASGELAQGDVAQAKTRLVRERRIALAQHISARALSMEMKLARIELRFDRPAEARKLAAQAFDRARAAGEVPAEIAALELIADIEGTSSNPAIEVLYRREHSLRDTSLVDLDEAPTLGR